jgi:hypothetical protein
VKDMKERILDLQFSVRIVLANDNNAEQFWDKVNKKSAELNFIDNTKQANL